MDLSSLVWTDHPANPLIGPSFPDWMIADPCVLPPEETPDGRWHLFANAIVMGIRHFTSDDGVAWTADPARLFLGIRPYVAREEGRYFLFYEQAAPPRGSRIALRVSDDLRRWGPARTVLQPQFAWEGRGLRTNGNPCLVRHDGRFRLYFSASWVFLRDCLFLEPRFIGLAESDRIEGPYEKRPEPLIGPAAEPYWRNLGAGSLKVIPPDETGGAWHAFNNGIYRDRQGRSRSEIHLLRSDDGCDWSVVPGGPLLAPEGSGWKRALVYAMHAVRREEEWRLYYNARDGWLIGRERIGLALGRRQNGIRVTGIT